MPNPAILAHAGLRAGGPGNTIEAFRAGLRAGADGIELDVRRTGDGVLVTHHDAKVGGLAIRSAPYLALQARAHARGYAIPTLGAALDAIPAAAVVDVELKEAGYEAAVLDVVRPRLEADRLLLTSFYASCLATLAGLAPDLRRGLLVAWPPPTGRLLARSALRRLVEIRQRRALAPIVAPHWRLLAAGGVPAAATRLVVWTVNTPSALRFVLRDPRVAHVVTDDVLLARAVRDAVAPQT